MKRIDYVTTIFQNCFTLYIFLCAHILIQCLLHSSLHAAQLQINDRVPDSVAVPLEYYEDKNNHLEFNTVIKIDQWKAIENENVNFGFTDSSYWFRFSVYSTSAIPQSMLFRISYPMIDYIELYQHRNGNYIKEVGGDNFPFKQRKIIDVGFVYSLDIYPGGNIYYFKIKTTSSLNFTAMLFSVKGFLQHLNREQPLIWIYYGLMIIMVVFNLFVFLSIRDISYLLYVVFITSWILLQMSLNGYAFQYLWSDHVWWGNNSLPFFMALTIVSCCAFLLRATDVLWKSRAMRIFNVVIIIIPGMLIAFVSLIVQYKIAIKVATGFTIFAVCILFPLQAYALLKKSRIARFFATGFLSLSIGVVLYSLKTFGVIPATFITQWSIQIGSAFVVLFLSFALADRINVMRKDIVLLYEEKKASEAHALQKASHLGAVVNAVNVISNDFVMVSNELALISKTFSDVSSRQYEITTRIQDSFSDLQSSLKDLHIALRSQKEEGKKSLEYAKTMEDGYLALQSENKRFLTVIDSIVSTAKSAETTLFSMIENMNVLKQGSNEIEQFVAVIDDISDKINLLSLNASIEAARAKEAGRGFAVVADEIGKLALATAEQSRMIRQSVIRIANDINSSVMLSQKSNASVADIFSLIDTVKNGITSFQQVVTDQSNALEKVKLQVLHIDMLSENILELSHTLNTVMQKTLDAVGTILAMAEEINTTNNKIKEYSQSISEKSTRLSLLVRG